MTLYGSTRCTRRGHPRGVETQAWKRVLQDWELAHRRVLKKRARRAGKREAKAGLEESLGGEG